MSKLDFKSMALGATIVGGVALAFSALNGGDRDASLVARIKAEVQASVKAEVQSGVAQAIKDNPKVLVETIQSYMQAQQERQAQDRDNMAVSQKEKLAAAEDHPIVGNPDGTIEIVYFFDANCAYCKRMDPVLKRVVAENPDVKVIHREIPILTETSRLAAQVANLVWQAYPGKYQEIHDRFLAHAAPLTEQDVEDYLRLVLSKEQADKLLAIAVDKEDYALTDANKRIKGNLELASAAGVTGTPFIYVLQGDGIIRGAGDDAYEQVTEKVVKARQLNKN